MAYPIFTFRWLAIHALVVPKSEVKVRLWGDEGLGVAGFRVQGLLGSEGLMDVQGFGLVRLHVHWSAHSHRCVFEPCFCNQTRLRDVLVVGVHGFPVVLLPLSPKP